jgi:hypothetical protein
MAAWKRMPLACRFSRARIVLADAAGTRLVLRGSPDATTIALNEQCPQGMCRGLLVYRQGNIVIESIADKVNSDQWLVHRGRYVDTCFLVELGSESYLVTIHAGRIESVRTGPFVMPRWTFALRASKDAWNAFWEPKPKPGFHDLMAMIKLRTLKIEGDQYVFIANLMYFKDVFASLRRSAA